MVILNMIKYIYTIIFTFNLLLPQLEAKLIAKNFEKPLYVTNYPNNNNKLLVLEQEGIIQIVQNNIVSEIPFLDISNRVHQPLYPEMKWACLD